MKNQKERTTAEVKKIQEEERAQRLNKLAQRIDEKNDLEDAGIKVFQYPLPRMDHERPSRISAVKVVHGSRSAFRKIGNK